VVSVLLESRDVTRFDGDGTARWWSEVSAMDNESQPQHQQNAEQIKSNKCNRSVDVWQCYLAYRVRQSQETITVECGTFELRSNVQ
jgi:hypothetical protein